MDALGRAQRAHSAFRPMVGSCVEFSSDDAVSDNTMDIHFSGGGKPVAKKKRGPPALNATNAPKGHPKQAFSRHMGDTFFTFMSVGSGCPWTPNPAHLVPLTESALVWQAPARKIKKSARRLPDACEIISSARRLPDNCQTTQNRGQAGTRR